MSRHTGDRHERSTADRARDEAIRRAGKPLDGRPPHAVWPPPAPERGTAGLSKLDRLNCYYEHLESLANHVHTCPNCLERSHDHGRHRAVVGGEPLGAGELCWFCNTHERELHFENGLDLDIRSDERCAAEGVPPRTGVPDSARRALAVLMENHGELSPMEEALISRVKAVTTVLMLPSGGQLGYRGNCINFVNDTASVAATLPRAVSDCGVVFYRVRGTNPQGEEVRID